MPASKTLAMVQTGAAPARAARAADPRDRRRRRRCCASRPAASAAATTSSSRALLRTPMPVIPGHEPLGVIERDRRRARRGAGASTSATASRSRRCSRAASARRASAAATTCAAQRRIYSYIPLSEPPGLWGAYAQHMFLAPQLRRAQDRPGAADPSLAVMFNPLGAGFRWAVEMPRTGPGDTVLILGPGQRGLASVIACREAGADHDHRHRPRRRRAQARARARVRRRPHDRRRERGRAARGCAS